MSGKNEGVSGFVQTCVANAFHMLCTDCSRLIHRAHIYTYLLVCNLFVECVKEIETQVH